MRNRLSIQPNFFHRRIVPTLAVMAFVGMLGAAAIGIANLATIRTSRNTAKHTAIQQATLLSSIVQVTVENAPSTSQATSTSSSTYQGEALPLGGQFGDAFDVYEGDEETGMLAHADDYTDCGRVSYEADATQTASTFSAARRSLYTPEPLDVDYADYDVDYDGDGRRDFTVLHTAAWKTYFPPLPAHDISYRAGDYLLWSRLPDGTYSVSGGEDGELDSDFGIMPFVQADDSSFFRALAHPFPFFNQTHQHVIISSNAMIHFGRSFHINRHSWFDALFVNLNSQAGGMENPPIISALALDLDPSCASNNGSDVGRGAWFFSNAQKTVITWRSMPLFTQRDANVLCPPPHTIERTTVQVVLRVDGSFEMRIGELPTDLNALVGAVTLPGYASTGHTLVTRGAAATPLPGLVRNIDLADVVIRGGETLQFDSDVSTIATHFGRATSGSTVPRSYLTRKFYAAHSNTTYDMFVVFPGTGTRADNMVVSTSNDLITTDPIIGNIGGTGWMPGMALSGFASNFSFAYGGTFELFARGPSMELLAQTSSVNAMTSPKVEPFKDLVTIDAPYFGALSDASTANNQQWPYADADLRYSKTLSDQKYRQRQSLLSIVAKALRGRWTPYPGFNHPNASAPAKSVQQLLSQTFQMSWSPWVNTALRRGHFSTPAPVKSSTVPQYRRDLNNGNFLIQVKRSLAQPTKFYDADDTQTVLADTPDFRLSAFSQRCEALGKELFVTAPGAFGGALSPLGQVMIGVRTVESLTPEEDQMFLVDEPQSAANYPSQPDPDMQVAASLSSQYAYRPNLAFCGRRVNFTISANVRDTTARASAYYAGALSAASIQAYFGPRSPAIGDKSTEVDWARISNSPALQTLASGYRLGEFPFVHTPNKQVCDSLVNSANSIIRRSATCVDPKSVVLALVVAPGQQATQRDLDTMANVHRTLSQNINTVVLDGWGARGRCFPQGYNAASGFPVYGAVNDGVQCTADYFPKFEVTLDPLTA